MSPVGPRLAMFVTSIPYTLMCLGAALTTSDPGTTGTSQMQLVCSTTHPYLQCRPCLVSPYHLRHLRLWSGHTLDRSRRLRVTGESLSSSRPRASIHYNSTACLSTPHRRVYQSILASASEFSQVDTDFSRTRACVSFWGTQCNAVVVVPPPRAAAPGPQAYFLCKLWSGLRSSFSRWKSEVGPDSQHAALTTCCTHTMHIAPYTHTILPQNIHIAPCTYTMHIALTPYTLPDALTPCCLTHYPLHSHHTHCPMRCCPENIPTRSLVKPAAAVLHTGLLLNVVLHAGLLLNVVLHMQACC